MRKPVPSFYIFPKLGTLPASSQLWWIEASSLVLLDCSNDRIICFSGNIQWTKLSQCISGKQLDFFFADCSWSLISIPTVFWFLFYFKARWESQLSCPLASLPKWWLFVRIAHYASPWDLQILSQEMLTEMAFEDSHRNLCRVKPLQPWLFRAIVLKWL